VRRELCRSPENGVTTAAMTPVTGAADARSQASERSARSADPFSVTIGRIAIDLKPNENCRFRDAARSAALRFPYCTDGLGRSAGRPFQDVDTSLDTACRDDVDPRRRPARLGDLSMPGSDAAVGGGKHVDVQQ